MSDKLSDETSDASLTDFLADYNKWALRKDRPWAFDIVRVLIDRKNGLRMQRIYDHVRDMRDPVDLPKVREFEATVRSTIYQHSKGSPKWTGNQDDDLFYSPSRGLWCVHVGRAKVWIGRHEAAIRKRHAPVPSIF